MRRRDAEPQARPGFRPDVDGLRAVAIVLVVAYHAGVPHVGGGFIGVDVFFVISGWLITRNLVSRADRTNSVNLLDFWSRRVRRLVPALFVVLGFVVVGTLLVINPLEWQSIGRQTIASALYASNIEFARIGNGYFAPSVETSPLLHTWSLGVEEQFYLVWPVFFLVAGRLLKKYGFAIRRTLMTIFVVTTVGSLATSILLSAAGSSWAFFGLPSRAWEFALAGMLAIGPIPVGRSNALRAVLAIGGLLLIGYAALTFRGSMDYPSYWALIPVLGTLGVIIAGDERGDEAFALPSKVLATSPMQWFGRVSYSWYLWHWPFIVFAVAWTAHSTLQVRLSAAIASLGVAAVVYHFYENPVRFSSRLSAPKRAFAIGGAMTAVGMLAGVLLLGASSSKLEESPYKELAAVRDAHLDDFGCSRPRTSSSGVEYCELGDPDAPAERTVLLAGDSHARQWQLAFGAAAEEQNIRVVVRWLGACSDVGVKPRSNVVTPEECSKYRKDTDRLIDDLGVQSVVLAQHPSNGLKNRQAEKAATGLGESWSKAVEKRIAELEAKGVTVGFVLDDPLLPEDPMECLADKPTCNYPTNKVMGLGGPIIDGINGVLAQHPDVQTFDGAVGICDADLCRTQVDGVYVYADSNHLARGFTELQQARIASFLAGLVDGTTQQQS